MTDQSEAQIRFMLNAIMDTCEESSESTPAEIKEALKRAYDQWERIERIMNRPRWVDPQAPRKKRDETNSNF